MAKTPQYWVRDDRKVECRLPVSQKTVIFDSPKAKHLETLEEFVKANPEMGNIRTMKHLCCVLSQDITMDMYDELDYEDMGVIGKALALFPPFRGMGQ